MTLAQAISKTEKMIGDFHSLHCHVFTKDSFVGIFDDLSSVGMIDWQIVKIQDVQFGGNEFLVILTR